MEPADLFSRGGVLTGEELAPFLDPPALRASSSGDFGDTASTSEEVEDPTYGDESFVLPALIKFGGEPFVDDKGYLLYRFPSLQRTGVSQVRLHLCV